MKTRLMEVMQTTDYIGDDAIKKTNFLKAVHRVIIPYISSGIIDGYFVYNVMCLLKNGFKSKETTVRLIGQHQVNIQNLIISGNKYLDDGNRELIEEYVIELTKKLKQSKDYSLKFIDEFFSFTFEAKQHINEADLVQDFVLCFTNLIGINNLIEKMKKNSVLNITNNNTILCSNFIKLNLLLDFFLAFHLLNRL